MHKSFKLIALDIGGVLASINKTELIKLCHKSQVSLSEIFDKNFWNFQKGLISSADFVEEKARKLHIDQSQFEKAFCAMLCFSFNKNIFRELMPSYIFFSSINTLHFEYLLGHLDASSFAIEHALLSFREGQLKPHPLFFEKLARVVPCEKNEILVIDDDQRIINAALVNGFSARHYDGSVALELFFEQNLNLEAQYF